MRFNRSMFGYQRDQVDRQIEGLQEDIERLHAELGSAKTRIAQLVADVESYKVTVAVLRRQRVEVGTNVSTSAQPVTVIVGPSDTLGSVSALIDDIETLPQLAIQFRVFRDGFYRVDGYAQNRPALMNAFRARADVRAVNASDETIHVTPKGVFS